MAINDTHELLEMVLVHIARCDDLAIFLSQKVASVSRTHVAAPDDSEREAFGRRSSAGATQYRGREDRRQCQRGSGRIEKTAAADLQRCIHSTGPSPTLRPETGLPQV